MSRVNSLTYEETAWLTNKHSPELRLIANIRRERPTKTRIFLAKITKFETPINAQQQLNNRSFWVFSKEMLNNLGTLKAFVRSYKVQL